MNNEAQNPEQKPDETPKPAPQSNPDPASQPAVSPSPPGPEADIGEMPITRKPAAPPQTAEGTMPRRTFIKWLTVGWAAFAAIVAGYGTLVLRYLFPNVLFEPKQSFLAGFLDEYEIGMVSERYKGKYGTWIVRDTEKLYALSTVCTHLGCTPNWLENDNKFKCPCHGSGFYKTGINFEGPAPRPLERFRIFLNDNGEIVIDKTRKFQQEKGEWDNPESYIIA